MGGASDNCSRCFGGSVVRLILVGAFIMGIGTTLAVGPPALKIHDIG